MKGFEVILRTPWSGPDPTPAEFRANAETRLGSYFRNEGRTGTLEPKDEFRGCLTPEVIRFIRDDGSEPGSFRYDLNDMLSDNRGKPSA